MSNRQILIKFSGEFFSDRSKIIQIAQELKDLKSRKIKLAVVCGGGNISRWKDLRRGNHLTVDFKGMRGTLANAINLFKALKKIKVPTQIYTSFSINSHFPQFDFLKAIKDWQKGKILIIAGGTGYPYFTTDTAAVLWALILDAQSYIKATKVKGVFDRDPLKNKRAKFYPRIDYRQYLIRSLKVIDPTAVSLAGENNLPIRVIKWQPQALVNLIKGQKIGSQISI